MDTGLNIKDNNVWLKKSFPTTWHCKLIYWFAKTSLSISFVVLPNVIPLHSSDAVFEQRLKIYSEYLLYIRLKFNNRETMRSSITVWLNFSGALFTCYIYLYDLTIKNRHMKVTVVKVFHISISLMLKDRLYFFKFLSIIYDK